MSRFFEKKAYKAPLAEGFSRYSKIVRGAAKRQILLDNPNLPETALRKAQIARRSLTGDSHIVEEKGRLKKLYKDPLHVHVARNTNEQLSRI